MCIDGTYRNARRRLLEMLAAIHQREKDAELAAEERAEIVMASARTKLEPRVARRRRSVAAHRPEQRVSPSASRRSSVAILSAVAATSAEPIAQCIVEATTVDSEGGDAAPLVVPAEDAVLAKLMNLPLPGDGGAVSADGAVLEEVLPSPMHGVKLVVGEAVGSALAGELLSQRRPAAISHEAIRRQILLATEDIPERPRRPSKAVAVVQPPPALTAPPVVVEVAPEPFVVAEPLNEGVSREDLTSGRARFAAGDESSLLTDMKRAEGNYARETIAVHVSARCVRVCCDARAAVRSVYSTLPSPEFSSPRGTVTLRLPGSERSTKIA